MKGQHDTSVAPSWTPPETDLADRTYVQDSCRVVSNDWVNAEYKHLVIEAAEGMLSAQPGQFFHLLCPMAGGQVPFLRRPMSIYRIDKAQGRLEFLYKLVGKGTHALASLNPGETLDLIGPLGKGFDLSASKTHLVQVARGVGLATLAPLAEAAAAQGVKTTAILSARTPELVMSVDYLRSVGAEVITVNDADGSSTPERIEAKLRHLIAKLGADYLTTCGSNRLLTLVRRLTREYGLRGEVALEQNMGCGIGMCFACVREFRELNDTPSYRRVCWDGPVFDVREVPAW